MELNQLTAIVTGGASGMGAATAKHLAKLGVKVAILDINVDAAKKMADEINGIAFGCDVRNENQIQDALNEVEKKFGIPRVGVNCAGIVHGKRMLGKEGPMPLDEFRHVIDVNVTGTFNLMRLITQKMITQQPLNETGERGVIINTASVAAFDGQIGQTAYSASKGAIVGMTLPAARELAQFGVRVMTIAPGLVDTPMFQKISPEARASLEATVPFPKRLAKPEEYALLVEQIIRNPMLNGEVIRLDGALRMQPK